MAYEHSCDFPKWSCSWMSCYKQGSATFPHWNHEIVASFMQQSTHLWVCSCFLTCSGETKVANAARIRFSPLCLELTWRSRSRFLGNLAPQSLQEYRRSPKWTWVCRFCFWLNPLLLVVNSLKLPFLRTWKILKSVYNISARLIYTLTLRV